MPIPPRVTKTEAEWRAQLDPQQYHVAREAATERPFTGLYWDTTTPGTYCCVCCHTPLFASETKYDAGCGWPSFWRALPEVVKEKPDHSHDMTRVEILCAVCDAHLGHVFPDGPVQRDPASGARVHQPRYCVNSASLKLKNA